MFLRELYFIFDQQNIEKLLSDLSVLVTLDNFSPMVYIIGQIFDANRSGI
jgi:hypothetical protein